MRNSQKALLAGLGVIVLGIAVLVILVITVQSAISDPEFPSDEPTTLAMDLSDFERVEIKNSWVVELTRGNEWDVELTFPDSTDPGVGVIGDQLILEGGKRGSSPWTQWGDDAREYRARITMPVLTEIVILGAADVQFAGFESENLDLSISGAANVEGKNGTIEMLDLTISGAGNVELNNILVKDAHVRLSGASNVELMMDGGELTGKISGMGNLSYSGSVSNEAVIVSGLGSVGSN